MLIKLRCTYQSLSDVDSHSKNHVVDHMLQDDIVQSYCYGKQKTCRKQHATNTGYMKHATIVKYNFKSGFLI